MTKFKLDCTCTTTTVSRCQVEVEMPTDDPRAAEAWATVALHPDADFMFTGIKVRARWKDDGEPKAVVFVKAEPVLELVQPAPEQGPAPEMEPVT